MTAKKVRKRPPGIHQKYDRPESRLLFVAAVTAVLLMELILSFAKGRVLADTEKNIRADGCVTSSFLQNGKAEQEELLRMLPYVKETGEMKRAGALYYDNSEKFADCIVLSPGTYKKMFLPAYTDVKGNYPKEEDELMCSKEALHDMGIDHPHLGMQVKTDFHWNNLWNFKGVGRQTFRLCGYFTEYANERYDTVFLSRARLQAASEPYFPCNILVEPRFDNLDGERLQELLERQVGTDGGSQVFVCSDSAQLRALQTMYGGYIQSLFFSVSLVVCIFLLVYNILRSFLTENIRQYGLLELLGASVKQVKRMIRRRFLAVAAVGCLVGSILGAGLVIAVLPRLLEKMLTTGSEEIGADLLHNPVIPAASNILVFSAFLLSLLLAIRKIGALTPTEAYHCREEAAQSRKKRHILRKHEMQHSRKRSEVQHFQKRSEVQYFQKRGEVQYSLKRREIQYFQKKDKRSYSTNRVTLMQLARRNVTRQKSKFALTVLSISLGSIVLLAESALWKGADQTEKIRKGPDVTIGIDGKFIDAFDGGTEQMEPLLDKPLLSEEAIRTLLRDAGVKKKDAVTEYGYLPRLIPKVPRAAKSGPYTEHRYIYMRHAAIIRTLSDNEYLQLKNYMKKEHIQVAQNTYNHHAGAIITHDNLLGKNPVDLKNTYKNQKEAAIVHGDSPVSHPDAHTKETGERIAAYKMFYSDTEEAGLSLIPCGYVNRLDNQFPIRNLVGDDGSVLYLFVSKDTFRALKSVMPMQILRMQFKLDKSDKPDQSSKTDKSSRADESNVETIETKLESDIADINEKMTETYGVKCNFLKLTTKTGLLAENKSNTAGTKTVLYTISLAFVVAGLLNYYSTLRSRYIIRKKEYRTYDNLGIGRRQMRKLLLCEGLVYFYAVSGVTMVLGTLIITFTERMARYYMYDFSYNYPVITFLLVEVSLLFLCIAMTNRTFQKIQVNNT